MRVRPILLIVSVASLLFAAVVQASPVPGANDYFISPDLAYGERVVYEIDFPSAPASSLGLGDMLVFNTGSVETYLQSVMTSLYVNGEFVGSANSGGPAIFALFSSTASGYQGLWPSTAVDGSDLSALFNGSAVGTLVITPQFSDPSGTARFSGWFVHAATANGSSGAVTPAWEEIYPSATVLSVSVVPISEPATISLVAAGLLAAMWKRRCTMNQLATQWC